MKLTPTRVAQTLSQFEAREIPDDHPAVEQLNRLFGEHTYFIDGSGLHVVEPAEPTATGAAAGLVVKLASWADDQRTKLTPHQPQPSDRVVVLDAAA